MTMNDRIAELRRDNDRLRQEIADTMALRAESGYAYRVTDRDPFLEPKLDAIRLRHVERGDTVLEARGSLLVVAETVRMGLAGWVWLLVLACLTAGLALLALLFMRPYRRIVTYTVTPRGKVTRRITKRVA